MFSILISCSSQRQNFKKGEVVGGFKIETINEEFIQLSNFFKVNTKSDNEVYYEKDFQLSIPNLTKLSITSIVGSNYEYLFSLVNRGEIVVVNNQRIYEMINNQEITISDFTKIKSRISSLENIVLNPNLLYDIKKYDDGFVALYFNVRKEDSISFIKSINSLKLLIEDPLARICNPCPYEYAHTFIVG